jgi:tetratricopeptide (TPR) repeat protein
MRATVLLQVAVFLLACAASGWTAQVSDPEFRQGLELVQRGRTAEAIPHLRAARQNAPTMVLLGLAYLHEGYPLDAAEVLEAAARQSPLGEKQSLLLVQAWHESFDFAKALGRASETVKRFPDSADAQFRVGYELETAGRFDEAGQAFTRAIELRPELAEAQTALGRWLLRSGKYQQARDHLEAALQTDPRKREARLELAKALCSLKQYTPARQLLDGLLRERDDEPEPHLWLSRVAQAEGDSASAARERARFLELSRDLTQPGGMSANLPAHKLRRYVP